MMKWIKRYWKFLKGLNDKEFRIWIIGLVTGIILFGICVFVGEVIALIWWLF